MLHIQENKSIKEEKKKLYSRRFVVILSIFLYVMRHVVSIRSFTVPWIGALFVFDFGISYAFLIIFSFFAVAEKKVWWRDGEF
jgi:hypothetical protein